MAMPKEKIIKVVAVANTGATEGERENAKRIVMAQCREQGLNYVEIMAGRWPQPKSATRDPFSEFVDAMAQRQASQQNPMSHYTVNVQYTQNMSGGRPMRSDADLAGLGDIMREAKKARDKHNTEIRERLRKHGFNI